MACRQGWSAGGTHFRFAIPGVGAWAGSPAALASAMFGRVGAGISRQGTARPRYSIPTRPSGPSQTWTLARAGAIRQALRGAKPSTAVALEATANWYWIVDEIEQASLQPRLVHPRKARLMMGQINKTDQLDAHGLNTLQRNGTLPTVWIPRGPLRDLK